MDGLKRIFISGPIVICLVALSGYFYVGRNNVFSNQAKALEVKDGLQICFSRLQQTYTSVYVSPNLSYLSLDFLKLTESCFSEALALAIESNALAASATEKLIHRLANQVIYFHSGIKNKSILTTNSGDYSVANSRFIKLEETKDQVIDQIDSLVVKLTEKTQKSQILIISTIAMALLGVLFMMYENNKFRKVLKAYQDQILKALSLDSGVSGQKDNTQAFLRAMKFFGIPSEVLDAQNVNISNNVLDETNKPNLVEKQKIASSSAIDRTLIKQENIRVQDKEFSQGVITFGDILGDVLLEYSPQILSQKISMSFNEFEDIEYKGDASRIYHLLKFMFGSMIQANFHEAPFINVQVIKKSSPQVRIHTNSLISNVTHNGTTQGSVTMVENLTSVIDSFEGDFDIRFNGMNSKGSQIIEIQPKKRLVKIFKGTKKDFMDSKRNSF